MDGNGWRIEIDCDSAGAAYLLEEFADWRPRVFAWVGDDIDKPESGYWDEMDARAPARAWDEEQRQADWQATGGY